VIRLSSAISIASCADALDLLSVTINITHTRDADLDIYLFDPSGNYVTLSSDNGGSGDNYVNTVFQAGGADITAGTAPFTGTYAPEVAFTTFLRGAANGTWTLRVIDDQNNQTGTLDSWSLEFTSSCGDLTYDWTPSTGLSATDITNPVATPTTSTTYTFESTATGCSSTDDVVITVNEAATASAGVDASICEESTFTASGSRGGSAGTSTWTTSGTGTFDDATIVGATYTPSSADIAAGSVTLTITTDDPAGPCNAATDAMTLTINAIATASAGVDGAICYGSTYLLDGVRGGSASSSTWTTAGDGTFDNATLTAATYTPGAADITATTAVLTITTNDPDNSGPCAAATDAMTLTINPLSYTEDFETGSTSMTLTTQSQSLATIDANSANAGTYGLRLGGGTSAGWSAGYSTGELAFTNSTTHIASASRVMCASTDPYLTLTFDKLQTYTIRSQYSWFRLTVDGAPVPDINGNTYFSATNGTTCGVWETMTYDLFAYANTAFTLAWEGCNRNAAGQTTIGCDSDNVYIDDIVFVESAVQQAPSTPGDITGFALPNAGSQESYTIDAVANTASYTWSIPAGWTLDEGQGTTSIVATTNSADGNVTVYSTNAAGNSGTRTLAVTTIEAITTFPDTSAFANEVQHSTNAYDNVFTFVETGWRNYSTDDGSWRADKGGTQSTGTGPGDGTGSFQPDHNPGTSDGYYLYVEASVPNLSETFYLWSPSYNLSALSNPVCTFWYSMYGGVAMGTLSVQVSADHGKTWSGDLNYTMSDLAATNVSGNQGTNWLQGFINLAPYTSETALVIRFTAVTGSGFHSDIAIDDVQVMDLSTATSVVLDGDIILSSDLFSASGSDIVITGSAATTITSNGYKFKNIAVNNSYGVTLSDDLDVLGNFTLTSGVVTTGSKFVIVRGTGASALTGGSGTAFIYGYLKRYIAANTETYAFPIGQGTTETDYFPIDLINNNLNLAGSDDYVQAKVRAIIEGGDNIDKNLVATHGSTPIINIYEAAIWNFEPSNTDPFESGSYGVGLGIVNISGMTDNTFTPVKRPSGSTNYADFNTHWQTTTIPDAGEVGRTVAGGLAIRLGYSSFSDHGAGGGSGPLPVKLIDFTADLNDGNVYVAWTVASQTNNDYFNVQRSIDGYDWENIATIVGAGTVNQTMKYNHVDREPYVGISYYRLKQTDYDGNFETFDPVAVSLAVEIVGLLISPNPVRNAITISTEGTVYNDLNIIRIYDSKGNVVLHNNLLGQLENYELYVGELASGVYIVRSRSRNQLGTGRFVKE